MANYDSVVRTNYFHVKDEEKFKELMSQVYGDDDIHIWTKKDNTGSTIFAFGCYGGIYGKKQGTYDETNEGEYEAFLADLQKCVAEDDAIILIEVGNEKLRYLNGIGSIITHKEFSCVSLEEFAVMTACEMLKNDNWHTDMTY